MTIFEGIRLLSPVIRVNNREHNINFYCKVLGLKILKEENAEVFFCAYHNPSILFTIEESPSMRARAVEGPKKLNYLYIKAAKAEEIEALLATNISFSRLFKGEKGYAFEVISPEKDVILLHAEDDRSSLQEISGQNLTFRALEGFKGLSDYQIDKLVLNVEDLAQSKSFYQNLQGLSFLPNFQEAQGPDLKVTPDTTWDIEIINYKIPENYNLSVLKEYFEARNIEVYMDKAQKVLVISDPSQIELWFSK
ncbi:CppA N-terminal domain-containing protein [Streptococcus dentapri]|uniref:CppA N-terminal domain-containing protein n=1 Tax=Streptococcus dentapri TaxID=573564 RepID=A0ABV8D047_9STRE